MEPVTLALVLGMVVPFLVSFLKNVQWSDQVKQGVAVAVSLVAAVGILFFDQGADIGLILSSKEALLFNFTVVFTTAQLFYKQWFSGTKVNAKLEDSGVKPGGD